MSAEQKEFLVMLEKLFDAKFAGLRCEDHARELGEIWNLLRKVEKQMAIWVAMHKPIARVVEKLILVGLSTVVGGAIAYVGQVLLR